MMHLFSLTNGFINFMQSGMYVDFILKQIGEMLTRNVFVYAAVFFGEKYIVEFATKKTIDNVTFYFNMSFLNKQYEQSDMYRNLLITVLASLITLEYWFLFV